jgi:hypothetical protein
LDVVETGLFEQVGEGCRVHLGSSARYSHDGFPQLFHLQQYHALNQVVSERRVATAQIALVFLLIVSVKMDLLLKGYYVFVNLVLSNISLLFQPLDLLFNAHRLVMVLPILIQKEIRLVLIRTRLNRSQ